MYSVQNLVTVFFSFCEIRLHVLNRLWDGCAIRLMPVCSCVQWGGNSQITRIILAIRAYLFKPFAFYLRASRLSIGLGWNRCFRGLRCEMWDTPTVHNQYDYLVSTWSTVPSLLMDSHCPSRCVRLRENRFGILEKQPYHYFRANSEEGICGQLWKGWEGTAFSREVLVEATNHEAVANFFGSSHRLIFQTKFWS